MKQNEFGTLQELSLSSGKYKYHQLNVLESTGVGPISQLPFSIKILLEQALRNLDGFQVKKEDVEALAQWKPVRENNREIPYKPSRVVLQDFTGVPAVVDLAAMRSAMVQLGGDPNVINPRVPVDLVIDHSVQVDHYGKADSLNSNMDIEFKRNKERYEFLKWGEGAFDNFRVTPPGVGIIHQVNLEYLANVVEQRDGMMFPDTLVGTDSHTTMINGIGVLGWGVGGIEAESVMLGQPIYMLIPDVIGFKITGELPTGTTATDLVLCITQILRSKGVVEKFVEFYGTGLDNLSLADRATIANMAPEYGATMGFFPVDHETLNYLKFTGRSSEVIGRVEAYCKAQGLFRTADTPDPIFTDTVELDLSTVRPALAGPKRPQDRIELANMKAQWHKDITAPIKNRGFELKEEQLKQVSPVAGLDGQSLTHGSVVIAAITSCTNTSNPSVLMAAGLLAKKAREKGLTTKPYVKTSLAPGSRVVTDYLEKSGLADALNELGFYTVGYGCTTCIGNSGPLNDNIVDSVNKENLVVASVLSGNRNFEGRINPHVKANYLASPPLVVAYAIAGRIDIDFASEPIGTDTQGNAVMLKDIWPDTKEVAHLLTSITPDMFSNRYGTMKGVSPMWEAIAAVNSVEYAWDDQSTYIQNPPFFQNMSLDLPALKNIEGARVLVKVADSVTTDHISPAGSIADNSPAGTYLKDHGVERRDFNSYGSRRGNDRVMTRGTFANVRIRNQMLTGVEGGYTRYLPTNEQMSIYDAAMKYQQDNTPLIVLAGTEYGTGSSRDWAAKGTFLLGVKAVVAASYERIHRSNLVGMGVLPLQFLEGQSAQSLGLTGEETYSILGISDDIQPQQQLTLKADDREIPVLCRLDTAVEIQYFKNGGILHTVLRNFVREGGK